MAYQVSRRDFLKAGGIGVAGIVGMAAGSIGIGSVLTGCSTTEVKVEESYFYVCPECGEKFESLEECRAHFAKKHPQVETIQLLELNINGQAMGLHAEDHWTLRETLLRSVGLTGNAKQMCDRGGCGSCSVLIDGKPALACTTLAIECEGRLIETSEGIAADPAWRPLLEAYTRNDTAQCGYCTPGQFVMAKYILTKYPDPTEEQIRTELSGNICRCGTYSRHVKAIREAAAEMKGERR